ncbi:tail fiber domain-containing protein [Tateyamaria omphalii]|uniref:tail fiber domain-containing protein n=1 Tax=Tateyamaria omphalii TaxID=299262 RepID=UPI001C998B3C|nr:tail fiber domain-containing protein [Tateyamaria omphalii]MBY5935563.1 tail fiber domain-containing protein [Tateyamaria omphalii]
MTTFFKSFGRSAALGTTALCLFVGASAAQNFTSDVKIQGSLCVGIDCSTSESFGFDTVRLKENNLRLHFDDTSASASFPSNDWRITINSPDNGGANFFSIDDATAGTSPLRVSAGAGNNAMSIDDSGDVGIGNSNAVVELHVTDGDSPTLRLEQNGSSGFGLQTWDLAGNETNFFLRDVTNSSQLPFRVFPNAGGDLLNLRSGQVGINDNTPDATLDIEGDGGDTSVLISGSANANLKIADTSNSGRKQQLTIENTGATQVFLNNTTRTDAQWLINAGNSFLLVPSDNTDDRKFELKDTGDLIIQGTLTQSSDKNRKMAIEPVNPTEILAKVRDMPVSEWTYIHDAEDGTRHIGPMAQDFYAAFGTGASDTGISSIDTGGVALAAIQALSAENATLKARLDALEAELDQN